MIGKLKKLIADLQIKNVNVDKLKEFLAEMESLYAQTVAAFEAKDMSKVEESMRQGMAMGIKFREYVRDFMKNKIVSEKDKFKNIFEDDDDDDEDDNDNDDDDFDDDDNIIGLEAKLGNTQVKEFSKIMKDISDEDNLNAKKLFTALDSQTLDLILQEKKRHQEAIKNIIAVSVKMPEKIREEFLKDKLDMLEEVNQIDIVKQKITKVKGMTQDALKKVDELKKTLIDFNFPPEVHDKILVKVENFNDKLLSVQDPLEAEIYINTFRQEIQRLTREAMDEKFKKGMIPFKNIDEKNSLFDEAIQLKNDGAIRGDKQGNIDLRKKLSRNDFSNILTNAVDRKINFTKGKQIIKEVDALRAVLNAYNIKPDFNTSDRNKLASFVDQVDLMDTNVSELNTVLTQEEAIELIGRAEEKWGNERN